MGWADRETRRRERYGGRDIYGDGEGERKIPRGRGGERDEGNETEVEEGSEREGY